MTTTARVAAAVVGSVLAVAAFQYARKVDTTSAATPLVNAHVGEADSRKGRVARAVVNNALETPAAVDDGPGPENVATSDTSAPAAAAAEAPTVFGLPFAGWIDALLGRDRSEPKEPAPTGESPTPGGGTGSAPGAQSPATAATVASAAQSCKHPLTTEANGITAQLDFVGILHDGQEVASNSFSATQLSDLKITVEWQNLVQNHVQRLDLFAPDGSLYQSLSRPLPASTAGSPVETRLPVHGSWITRYGLYGSWCVEVFLDHDGAPITSRPLVISRSS